MFRLSQKDQRDRETLLEVLARHHLVKAILGKEIGPALELAFVERVTVSAIEIGKPRPQLHWHIKTGCSDHRSVIGTKAPLPPAGGGRG
jgi:hypothetical protein